MSEIVPNSSPPRKKVLIIGAGPSGLVALKEFLEAGCVDPICVDAKSKIGGIFSVSYDELYTTTTNMFMAFSDFPPKESIRYWSKEEYLQYLNDYVDHFKLRKYIKLSTAVKNCALDKDTGRWKILTKTWSSTPGEMRRGSILFSTEEVQMMNIPNHERASYNFRQNVSPGFTYDADYLIVASGTNQVPNIPDFPNLSPDVEVVHSADFTNAEEVCKGKRVLIVGNGESAADIAAQSTDVAEKVTLYSRRDFSLGFRFASKFLSEEIYNERGTLTNQDDLTPNDMLEAIANNRILSRLPLAFFSILLDAMLSDVTSRHGEDSPAGITAAIMKKNFKHDFYALDTSAPTKSGGMLAHSIACKGLDIIISPEMKISGSTARFKNVSFLGKKEEKVKEVDLDVDVIILCTGYQLNFDWINIEGELDALVEPNPRKWFKHCFPPGLGDRMAFLGYARPNQGGIPQCSELLARYVTLLLKGERNLPQNYADQALREGEAEEKTFWMTRSKVLIEFPPFASSMARLIQCEPSSVNLLSPMRFVKYWTLPQWMCFYRLNGPGANPKACWDVVDKYRVIDTLVPFPLIIFYILFGILMQPLFISEYIMQRVLKEGDSSKEVLPRWYKMRVGGHFYQLSGNDLRLKDLFLPSSGWLVVEILFMFTFYFSITYLLYSVPLLALF